MEKAIAILAAVLLFGTNAAYADEGHGMEFPAWTYWVEVAEHAAMTVAAIGAMLYLLPVRKSAGKKMKIKIDTMIFGLILLALSQIVTDMQHLLIYPFGIWTAIAGHGILLAAVAVMIYAYIGLLNGRKS